jgi:uncharacterized protein (DUF305 family)
MKNINYKYTTWFLLLVLAVTFFCSVFPYGYFGSRSNIRGDMNGMHSMRGGSMMMGDGSMTMGGMVGDLKGRTGKDLEKAFITGMIPHHQGAVDMAKLLLQDKTVDPQLQKFANDIITAQESEIGMMNVWLKSY